MSIINDHYTEDKGYNRLHRQTEGGLKAYYRGEKPLSKWNKKTIIKGILKVLRESEIKAPKIHDKIKYHLSLGSLTIEDLSESLNKRYTQKQLIDKFLVFTGIHYTGNYYRYTEFYGIKSIEELEKIITKEFYKVTQLKLNLTF